MKNNCQRLFNRVPVSSSQFEQAFILETTKYFKNLYKTLNVKTSEGALTGKESKIEEAKSYETLSVVCAEVDSCKLSEKGLFCKSYLFFVKTYSVKIIFHEFLPVIHQENMKNN